MKSPSPSPFASGPKSRLSPSTNPRDAAYIRRTIPLRVKRRRREERLCVYSSSLRFRANNRFDVLLDFHAVQEKGKGGEGKIPSAFDALLIIHSP